MPRSPGTRSASTSSPCSCPARRRSSTSAISRCGKRYTLRMANPVAATPVAQEDCPFRHYTLKHRVIAWTSVHLFDRVTYTVRHGLLKGMQRKGGLGWVPRFSPGVMTPEIQFLSGLDLSGMTVYDVVASTDC